MIRQRIYGVIILVLCAVILVIAAQGTTPEESNCTVVLFLLPLGIYMVLGRTLILYPTAESLHSYINIDDP